MANADGGGDVSVLFNKGNGTFSAAMALALADLDADGKMDIVVSSAGLGNQQMGFDRPNAIAVGALNADGKPDIAVTHSASDDVSVLLNSR